MLLGAFMSDTTRKPYRFLTGEDTAEFCARVSTALEEGYSLYGHPVMVMDGGKRIVGQAVILPVAGAAGNLSSEESIK